MRTLAVAAIFCVGLGVAAWEVTGALLPAGPASTPATPVAAGPERFRPAEAPRAVPSFAFTDAEGRRMQVSDFSGRFVLLNLWATWCGPCVKEMPALDRLQATLGGREFEVVALSTDRGGRATVEPFLAKLGTKNLAMYLDPQAGSMAALGARGLPTTLLIDPDGREMGRLEGAAEWDSPEMIAFLRKHVGRRGPARDSGIVKTGG